METRKVVEAKTGQETIPETVSQQETLRDCLKRCDELVGVNKNLTSEGVFDGF
jgi:hypothetical protein